MGIQVKRTMVVKFSHMKAAMQRSMVGVRAMMRTDSAMEV
jgi:hypothetical protein